MTGLPVADVLGVDWQTLVDSVGLGAAYALMAVGIGLVFGVLPARIGSRPVSLVAAVSSAIAWTSRMCRPQNSAICSNDKDVLSTSQAAVAWGMSGWATLHLRKQ